MLNFRLVNFKLSEVVAKTRFGNVQSLSTQLTSRQPDFNNSPNHNCFAYRNVGQHLDLTCEKYGDREAIVSSHENQRYTYAAVREKVDKLAAAFMKLGLKKGDTVGIWAPNNIQCYLSTLAAARSGLISVGINPVLQAPEVEYCINKVGIKAIVAPEVFRSQRYYEILESIAPEIGQSKPGKLESIRAPTLKSVIIDSKKSLPGAFTFEELFDLPSSEEASSIRSNLDLVQPDSPCNIQFTPGTTGKPKPTILSHYELVNYSTNANNTNDANVEVAQRICTHLPLFHAFGVAISIMAGMSHGATLVLPDPGFKPEASLKAIVIERCTVIHGTPTMYEDLMEKRHDFKFALKSIEIGAVAGRPPSVLRKVFKKMGLRKVTNVFGMTEKTAVLLQSLIGDTEDRVLETVGQIQHHIEAKVVDAEGNVVPFGQPGELCIRGYMNMLGDQENMKEMIGGTGWLKTGDEFIMEENGHGKIVGRLRETITKKSGENVIRKEIEDTLNAHPDIKETYVIGIPDECLGEEICAFVTLRNGVSDLTQSQIKEFCKGKIQDFKVPRFVIAVEDFPKRTTGEIQKFKLKEIFDKVVKV